MSGTRQRVLFLCTHNSARSQMAEAWLHALTGDRYEACSAGTVATAVRSEAIEVMREAGIDMSAHTSKTLDSFVHEEWDTVITVCDAARDACPVFHGARRREHWSFPDPSAVRGDPATRLAVFRTTRDAIRARVVAWISGKAP